MIVIGTGAAIIISIAVSLYLLHPPPQEVPASVEISGLKDTYRIGERINFNVTVTPSCFEYPNLVMVKDLQNGKVVWLFNGSIYNIATLGHGCTGIPGRTYNTEQGQWKNGYWIQSPIIINKTGNYAAIAKYAGAEEEQEFYVISDDINHNNTTLPQTTYLPVQAPVFGTSWRYAGNVTLPPSEWCYVGWPCATLEPAEKYVNDKGDVAYLVNLRSEQDDAYGRVLKANYYHLVIINDKFFCDSTNDEGTVSYDCPQVIN
jgi:hypothetical protein